MPIVHGAQILGRRDNQEDSFRIVYQDETSSTSDILMLLADGMGGHAAGEIASQLAIEAFEKHFVSDSRSPKPRTRLSGSLKKANEAIAARVRADVALKGMGCTLVGCLKVRDQLHWVSVGDSPLYLYRGGSLSRINADHSIEGEMMELVRKGRMKEGEARSHPQRHVLRSAVIGGDLPLVDLQAIRLEQNDLVVIATDGVETLSEDEITRIIARENGADSQAIASALLGSVQRRERPNQDNTTIIVYQHPAEEGLSAWVDRVAAVGGRALGISDRRTLRIAGLAAVVAGVLGIAAAGLLLGLGGSGDEPEIAPGPAQSPPKPEATPVIVPEEVTPVTVPEDRTDGPAPDPGISTGGDTIAPAPRPAPEPIEGETEKRDGEIEGDGQDGVRATPREDGEPAASAPAAEALEAGTNASPDDRQED